MADNIYWKNHVWAVTDFGMETWKAYNYSRFGYNQIYPIEAAYLNERRFEDESVYQWPIHMAEKNWVDLHYFLPAFSAALEIHWPFDLNFEHLAKSYDRSLKVKAEGERYRVFARKQDHKPARDGQAYIPIQSLEEIDKEIQAFEAWDVKDLKTGWPFVPKA